MRYEEPMQYDQYQRGPGGPARPPAVRPAQTTDRRSEPSITLRSLTQDAAYTRPRPPGARDQFGPQDDTDPLNIVPLNTGNYS